MDKNVSSSGAPRKIEGMKSMQEWEIDMAIIKMEAGSSRDSGGERKRRNEATRLMWIPGARPVKTPANIPKTNAIDNSRSMEKIT